MNSRPEDTTQIHPEQETTLGHSSPLPPEDFRNAELEQSESKSCCCLNCAKRALMNPEHRCSSQDH